ncbi:MAG: hypothetical protein ACRCX2_15135 [Paraclostridium sp.]
MKNLENMKWGNLSQTEKELLLKNANCIDGITCNNVDEGECIVDLNEKFSVSGKVVDYEIIIDDESVIYKTCD